MGQKIDPRSLRLGLHYNWQSRWFPKKNWGNNLREDVAIRQITHNLYPKSGIVSIEIERSGMNKIDIVIKTARPGILIGRGGEHLNNLKKKIQQKLVAIRKETGNEKEKVNLNISIEEVKKPNTYAAIIAQTIALDIEKRVSFRRAVKRALSRVLSHKEVQGVKIQVSGRLDGNEISRSEWFLEGKMPSTKLRANIDFAKEEAYCTYGTVGIKVWIYKGDIL